MSEKSKIAIAAMVKTPGLTPVKTRLSKDVGQKNAQETFELCLAALEHELSKLPAIAEDRLKWQCFWAVHEPAALTNPRWQAFATIWQGEGGLGEKLDRVYQTLHECHDAVCLIGGDTPHLTSELWHKLVLGLGSHEFVVGPSRDGGFYLMAGRKPVPGEVWQRVKYSDSETCAQLIDQLRNYGGVMTLETLQDIDHLKDLRQVLHEMPKHSDGGAWSKLRAHLNNLVLQHSQSS